MFDVLGSGRVASIAVGLLARWQPRLGVKVVTSRRIRGVATVDADHLTRSRAPLVIATSIDEGRHLASRPWSRAALAEPNLEWILGRLPPHALAGRLVIVVTNPVEPIVDALARLEPTARLVGFGLTVDRARFLEIVGGERRLRLRGVSGAHASGAIAQVETDRDCDPRTLVEQLRVHRSPFAPRVIERDCHSCTLVEQLLAHQSAFAPRGIERDCDVCALVEQPHHRPAFASRIADFAVDALAADVDAAAPGDRARAFVEGGAHALCEAERVGPSPPARRGGYELARAITRLVGGGRVIVSGTRGPAHLSITPHGAQVAR